MVLPITATGLGFGVTMTLGWRTAFVGTACTVGIADGVGVIVLMMGFVDLYTWKIFGGAVGIGVAVTTTVTTTVCGWTGGMWLTTVPLFVITTSPWPSFCTVSLLFAYAEETAMSDPKKRAIERSRFLHTRHYNRFVITITNGWLKAV